ncbi:MAG: hypothetical protein LC803_17785 [Acidobacteria bacterium]|nr:hypothetical protein [Acidobacteriota bacterium]
MGRNVVDCPRYNWYAVYTKPKQEWRAERNLCAWGLNTFAPKIKVRLYNQTTGKTSFIVKPLFPKYIFTQIAGDDMLHKVCFTRGVHNVVSFGSKPCPVDDEIISIIMSRQDEDGFVRVGEEIHPGDKVVISEGPLRNFMGVLEGRHTGEDRVSVLLTTVSYQSRVVIGKEMLRKVA